MTNKSAIRGGWVVCRTNYGVTLPFLGLESKQNWHHLRKDRQGKRMIPTVWLEESIHRIGIVHVLYYARGKE
jgi:hypothetical protein